MRLPETDHPLDLSDSHYLDIKRLLIILTASVCLATALLAVIVGIALQFAIKYRKHTGKKFCDTDTVAIHFDY